jgi:hypothetical protein
VTDAERRERIDALVPWIREIVHAFGLAHWHIRVPVEEVPDEEAVACFHRRTGHNEGRILLSDGFFTSEPDEQRHTIVHELCHAHMRPVWEAWVGLDEILGKPAYVVLRDQMINAEEWVADSVTRAIAAHFPLPPGGE